MILTIICPYPTLQNLVPLLYFIQGYFLKIRGGEVSEQKKREQGLWSPESRASHTSSLLSRHFCFRCPKLCLGLVTPDFPEGTIHCAELDKTDKTLRPSLSYSDSASHSRLPLLGGQPGCSWVTQTWLLPANGQGYRARGM